MRVNIDPSREPNLRVGLQRRLGGILLEAGSAGVALSRRLSGARRPDHRFIVFGRGRSGSTLLVSMLDNHPAITCAGEVLRFRTINPKAHLDRVLNAGTTPVSGAKLLSYQMRDIHKMSYQVDFLRKLADEGVTIIYLVRENLVRHAISNIYARAQRIYHRKSGDASLVGQTRPKIMITVAEITAWIEGSAQLGEYEKAVLNDVPHRPLTYERDLSTPAARAITWADLLAQFELGFQPIRTTLQKITGDDLRQIIANHDELIDGLTNTPYSRFLALDEIN